MQDYLLIIALLSVPFLLGNIKVFRKGLILGLLMSLIFWGKINPILCLVPLVPCIIVFFTTKNTHSAHLTQYHYIKNPAFPMMTIFVASMAIFCAFDPSFANYGAYLNFNPALLTISADIDIIAYILGPIFFGNLCDRWGPFASAITLTLVAEASVLMASFGHANQAMFVVGSFLLHLCSAAFFVVMPMVVIAFYGENSLLKVYPMVALNAAAFWIIARLIYLYRWEISYNPGDLLISLVILTAVSALFLLLAWRKRFILVMDKNQNI